MADYEFVTVWEFDAPISAVWKLIHDADTWPEWWPGVVRNVELKPGDENGIGSVRRSTWKSKLPYTLEFDSEIMRVDHHKQIEARAFGELDGTGLWTFEELGPGRTRVRYDWRVKTTRSWMNLLSPVARPFFRWNHDVIMRWGERGLRDRLTQPNQIDAQP